jgi:imidazoleglycerol-phosphate dehydratase
MESRIITVNRKTGETDIRIKLDPENTEPLSVLSSIPFFDHLLQSMAFHGGFSLDLKASGDTDVDYHHLVEDTGLVLGTAFFDYFQAVGGVRRFGFQSIPMDEALSTVTIDVCGRPCLVYNIDFPQPICGEFDMALLREFFTAFTNNARINLHITNSYGKNSHHIAESVFKAFGKCLKAAYTPVSGNSGQMSTKGKI